MIKAIAWLPCSRRAAVASPPACRAIVTPCGTKRQPAPMASGIGRELPTAALQECRGAHDAPLRQVPQGSPLSPAGCSPESQDAAPCLALGRKRRVRDPPLAVEDHRGPIW